MGPTRSSRIRAYMDAVFVVSQLLVRSLDSASHCSKMSWANAKNNEKCCKDYERCIPDQLCSLVSLWPVRFERVMAPVIGGADREEAT